MMARKILIVGGTGLIGGAAALHLASLGYAVTIAGRTAPRAPTLAVLPFIAGSYLGDEFNRGVLEGFDTLVFAACNDIRQLPPGADEFGYFHRANSIGVPAFFARARDAGIERAVYVGSYYSELVSAERIAKSGYLISRQRADEGVRALASRDFAVCSLNAPFVIGYIEDVRALHLQMLVAYLLRRIEPEGPRYVIPGGANFMSTRSFAEGIAGAIERGESGRAYLMGDESWTFERYFNCHLEALGSFERVQVRDAPHPVLPDTSLYAGRGATLAYEPNADLMARLRYRRHDAERAIFEMVPYYRSQAFGG